MGTIVSFSSTYAKISAMDENPYQPPQSKERTNSDPTSARSRGPLDWILVALVVVILALIFGLLL
jgi:hypothetical protein